MIIKPRAVGARVWVRHGCWSVNLPCRWGTVLEVHTGRLEQYPETEIYSYQVQMDDGPTYGWMDHELLDHEEAHTVNLFTGISETICRGDPRSPT